MLMMDDIAFVGVQKPILIKLLWPRSLLLLPLML
jgi:hypothetical protein